MEIKTVNQVTLHIKELLESAAELSDIWVEGEVSNFKRASSGHCYFTLKDNESELRCVMWRGQAARLAWEPEQGNWVEAHGYISVYERGGYYQFYVDLLQHSGVGRLWQRFLELKERLEAEGLFAAERKRPLPEWPQRIGIVTSPTGAALQDIQNVLRARYPLIEAVVAPAMVQGVEAPATIVRALNALNSLPDLDIIIIARGGGSLEDLWAFNDERVARAVASSRTPTISGVGHETDFTICDFVADARAPTPSAAAALAVPDGADLLQHLAEMRQTLAVLMQHALGRLHEATAREARALLAHHPQSWIAEMRQRLDIGRRQIDGRALANIENQRQLVESLRLRLYALDTRNVLERGYAILQDADTGAYVSRVRQMHGAQDITITMADGYARSTVRQVNPSEEPPHEKD
ncbi:MAG: exodeoxyribonuclease VII large subunit [Chloroflexi bacterium]|nr:exodeoxyribonuclease VII large subunit [Chloroflexota bacterium]